MKKILTPCLLAALMALVGKFSAVGQGLPGYSSGNYTGVNGVFSNPANIADSRYRWDLNLFGFNMLVGNNKASFGKKDFDHFDGDTITHRLFAGGSGPASAIASLVFTGPSLFFNVGKKSAIALTTQSRLLVNIADVDSKLGAQLLETDESDVALPYHMASSKDMLATVNGYTAFGLSYSRVVYAKGTQFLKAGITLKYLAGAFNGFAQVDRLNGTIDEDNVKQDTYLTGASGAVAIGLGGASISDLDVSELLNFESTGFGGDIGFVYEYRPDTNRIYGGQNNYKVRVGLSLLDVGGIRYKRDVSRSGNYQVHIPDGERFYLSTLTDATLDDIKDSLASHPEYFTPGGSNNASTYKMSLPTRLRLEADYHIHRGLFVDLQAQAALSASHNNPATGWYYSAVTLTPRYEGRGFGFYVPLTYSSLSGSNAGVALRLGPLYLGSGSIVSAALGTSRRADLFVGLHLGGLKKMHRVKHKKHDHRVEAAGRDMLHS